MSARRVLVFLALIGFSSSQTSDCSYFGLLSYLNLTSTKDLLSFTRPVKNWTRSTLVQLDMLLYGILDVQEKSQTVTSHIWIQMHWKNEYLTWNSSDFCGINTLTVLRSLLWIPDVTIQEEVSDTQSVKDNPYVIIYPNGLVLANGHQLLTSTCQLDLFLFPFDTQHCNITFLSLNYKAEAVKLGAFNSDTTLTSISERIMITQGEWQLRKMEIIDSSLFRDNVSRSKLTYRVIISRKPMLYVINLIVPLFYLLVLDLASFFIGETQGEKLSFKVTLLLSISVLLLILQDMLPSTEDHLPVIASYCVAIFAMVWLSVLEVMLVSFLMNLDGFGCKEAQSSVNDQMDIQLEANRNKGEDQNQVKPDKRPFPLTCPNDHNLLKQILQEVKATRQEVGNQDHDKRKPGRYRRLVKIIDSVFFVLYFLTVLIFLLSMYTVWLQDYVTYSN
ncbi:5-hydroxytryptamine receptor 3A [Mastacembelus armatus]|uniref:5-hydroxytryptamine receptor 3A n=1 Tax=Mastacembelus armatus TaxID=205130 RepID=UPI000E454C16|nr:5-hydroxytryptamine receptor 3A-like [Mastacembelus armatus]